MTDHVSRDSFHSEPHPDSFPPLLAVVQPKARTDTQTISFPRCQDVADPDNLNEWDDAGDLDATSMFFDHYSDRRSTFRAISDLDCLHPLQIRAERLAG